MQYPHSNILIESMPEADRARLKRLLKPVSLPVQTPLYQPGETPQHIHFLTSGIASIVTTMADGATAEVATVGREGAPQGLHLMGPVPVATRCFMQIAGTGLRMEYNEFQELFEAETAMRRPIMAYTQYQSVLLGQVAGCNRLHTVEARLARWFLMVYDRTADPVLKLTQEFISEMMGTQRTTVSAIAGGMQQRGLIAYSRGTVKIIDGPGLEKTACECYSVSRKVLSALYQTAGETVLGQPARQAETEAALAVAAD